MKGLARRLVLAAIDFYKRHLSPRKGFSCAYRVNTGRASCSTLGYRAVRRHGVFKGLGLARERTWRCAGVHREVRAASWGPRPPGSLSGQRGDCDPGCDVDPGCDPGCDGWDAADCASDACQCVDIGDPCGGRRGDRRSERQRERDRKRLRAQVQERRWRKPERPRDDFTPPAPPPAW